MSDDLIFAAGYGARNANCKRCKKPLEKGTLRLGKKVSSPWDSGTMMQWFHIDCIFDSFKKARATTRKIAAVSDIENFDSLKTKDQDLIKSKIKETVPNTKKSSSDSSKKDSEVELDEKNRCSFLSFGQLIKDLASTSRQTLKSQIVSQFIKSGSSKTGFIDELNLVLRLLMPGVIKLVFNIQDKMISSIFCALFHIKKEDFNEHLEQGDLPLTVKYFFKNNSVFKPAVKSTLALTEIDKFLKNLAEMSTEDEKKLHFKKILPVCTSTDLLLIMRLIKHDLRINAGAKQILDGLNPRAYEIFQSCHDLDSLINKVLNSNSPQKPSVTRDLSISIKLLSPIRPMLAEACKSVEQALNKCSNSPNDYLLAEIKYDGERVQIHKKANQFHYFSRSLKTLPDNKVSNLKEFIGKAFPEGEELILDAEILLYDLKNKKPLPFGTLAFKDATVCLFVFDILFHNGSTLTAETIHKRRELLEDVIKEIPGHVMLSEKHLITEISQLNTLLSRVFSEGLEGLTIYEPGKRHWLKIKKDYLAQGTMADTADLLVLGAYFGTGKKGGLMSVFLMGSFNPDKKCFQTVTKVGNGFTDERIVQLQDELDMVKISKNIKKVPDWLDISSSLLPDFVIKDPKSAPIWEITGAQFSKAGNHTAGAENGSEAGISIRFPRVTKERPDKSWKEATNIPRLKELYDKSIEPSDIDVEVMSGKMTIKRPLITEESASPSKKIKLASSSKHLDSLFNGKVFVATSEVEVSSLWPKLKRKIISSGGDISEDQTASDFLLCLDQNDLKTHNISPSKSNKLFAVTLEWLKECFNESKIKPINS